MTGILAGFYHPLPTETSGYQPQLERDCPDNEHPENGHNNHRKHKR
jgi:hypothetical protein